MWYGYTYTVCMLYMRWAIGYWRGFSGPQGAVNSSLTECVVDLYVELDGCDNKLVANYINQDIKWSATLYRDYIIICSSYCRGTSFRGLAVIPSIIRMADHRHIIRSVWTVVVWVGLGVWSVIVSLGIELQGIRIRGNSDGHLFPHAWGLLQNWGKYRVLHCQIITKFRKI